MIGRIVEAVERARDRVPGRRALLVAVSGIDGSGKGFVSARLVAALRARGWNAVALGADPWLHLPGRRFSEERPAEHFYENAFRFDEMFARLVLPLKERRRVRIEADVAEETAAEYRRGAYELDDVDIVVLEGIFLLRRDLRRHYDLSIWIDCSFETALGRAIVRGQEGLPPRETVRAYETVYFPAQRVHFAADAPRSAADLVVRNDTEAA